MEKWHMFATGVVLGVISNIACAMGDYNFRFNHKTITIRDLAPRYSSAYYGAALQYAQAAGFSFLTGPANLDPPYSGNVAFEEGDFGYMAALGANGLGMAYNANGEQCVYNSGGSTGACTLSGADFGLVRFNTITYSSLPSWFINRLVRHEFNHVLGMGHESNCNVASIMVVQDDCAGYALYDTLQPYDTGIINLWYP